MRVLFVFLFFLFCVVLHGQDILFNNNVSPKRDRVAGFSAAAKADIGSSRFRTLYRTYLEIEQCRVKFKPGVDVDLKPEDVEKVHDQVCRFLYNSVERSSLANKSFAEIYKKRWDVEVNYYKQWKRTAKAVSGEEKEQPSQAKKQKKFPKKKPVQAPEKKSRGYFWVFVVIGLGLVVLLAFVVIFKWLEKLEKG